MTQLQWFPFTPGQWRAETGSLSREQIGALLLAVCAAWESEQVPCALPDDDRQLARLLGAAPKPLVAMVRMYFQPDPEERGWLRWPWLWTIWTRQAERYEKRSTAGRSGGKAAQSAKRPVSRFSNARNRTSNAPSNAPVIASIAPPEVREVQLQNKEHDHMPAFHAAVDAVLTQWCEERQVPPSKQAAVRYVWRADAASVVRAKTQTPQKEA